MKTFTWDTINKTLFNKGWTPAQIARIHSAIRNETKAIKITWNQINKGLLERNYSQHWINLISKQLLTK